MRSNSAKTITKDQEPSQANQCLTKNKVITNPKGLITL